MLSIVLIFLLCAPEFATESENCEYTIEIDNQTEITLIVPTEYTSEIDASTIEDLITENSFNNGDVITIQKVGYAGNPESGDVQPRFLYTYETTVEPISEEFKVQDYFVISVAKGQTSTLSSTFTRTLGVNITSGTAFSEAELSAGVTAEYSTTYEFVGPPEESEYNSREFRVQFYAHNVKWTQKMFLLGQQQGEEEKGTAIVTTKYLLYSIDHIVS